MTRTTARSFPSVAGLVLALLAALVVGVVPAAPAAAIPQQDEWDFVAALNGERHAAGQYALLVRADLRRIARAHAARIASQSRLHHNPNLTSEVGAVAPQWERLGENVGRGGEVEVIHRAFMASSAHRGNILGDYTYVGIGVARDAGGQLWVTQVFLKAPLGAAPEFRVPVTRLAGGSGVATSLAVSRRAFPDGGSRAVVLARSDVFADALAGGPLAASGSGPVLLTPGDRVPPELVAEARRVLAPLGRVYILGGFSAIAPTAEAAFLAAGLVPVRVAGATRYETAVRIAALVNPLPGEVILASGTTFPDAVVAGVPAAVRRAPILLTSRDELPAATRAYLAANPQTSRVVVGGPAAVSDAVARDAGAAERIAGVTRYDTAAQVAQRWFPSARRIALGTGTDFPDALVGTPVAAGQAAPILLVADRAADSTLAYVRSRRPMLEHVLALGGRQAVDDRILALLAV